MAVSWSRSGGAADGAPVYTKARSGVLSTDMNDVAPALAQRAVAGDREAFAAIIECRWAALVRLARSVLGDLEAEDAVQDGLIAAWGKLGSLRDPSRCSAWLSRIVVRTCLKRLRRRRFLLPLASAPERTERSNPTGRLEVERILAALAPRQRAVMHLTAVEGMSDREIGDVLRISAGSVRAHRRRARDRLERILAKESRP